MRLASIRYLTTRPVLCGVPTNQAIKAVPASKNNHELDVKPVIGLEVHAQLNIKSKLFSQGANLKTIAPNSQLDLFDISLPGTLPKINLNAIKAALLTALGLNCTIQDVIHFDRKNYFYTDMPAGFQITQHSRPIAINGYLDFIVTTYHHSVIAHMQHYDAIKNSCPKYWSSSEEFDPYAKRSKIKQIQLEQDSAKTISHTIDGRGLKLVDYNRCGTALLEIVFEPDLTNAHEASSLVRELIMLLRALKVCDCDLHEGSLRVDANVSIGSIAGQLIDKDIARKVELKNLNSSRSLNQGILAEIERQSAEIMLGNKILQESRSYDTKTGKTEPLRAKEEDVDYRFMPEPNIPPIQIIDKMIEETQSKLVKCELPKAIRERLRSKFNLDELLILELIEEPGLSDYFEEIMEKSSDLIRFDPDRVADFLIYSVNCLRCVDISTIEIDLSHREGDFWLRFPPNKMRTLFEIIFKEEISFANGLEVLKCMLLRDDKVFLEDIIKDLDLCQTNDDTQIEVACRHVINGMKSVQKKYLKTGNPKNLKVLLDKLIDTYNGRINLRKAADHFKRLRDEHTKEGQVKK